MGSHLISLAVTLFAVFCVFGVCQAENHLVPKHGLKTMHHLAKRDLSETDVERILKALMMKLEHKVPEVDAKVHYTDMKESEMKYASKSYPAEYDYVKETYSHESDPHEMEEEEMKAFSMKLKELGIEDHEESYDKEAYFSTPEEKIMSEKVHLLKNPVLKEESKKVSEELLKDKFNDKEVSMAESLYHMKIAGDVETYPHIKMEPLHAVKMADEKLHLEKVGSEETFLKKVDELGKTLLKEDHFKEGDIEAYLKKIAEDEKSHIYGTEIAHAESHIKGAEEKALEAWKTSHKDIFIPDKELLDDKLKKEAAHHKEGEIVIGMNDELIKKIKTLDEELAKEHDELLHTLSGKVHKDEMIAEGTTAYEKAKEQAHKDAHIHLADEEMKRYFDEALAFGTKEKAFSTDMLFGKGLAEEKIHGIDGKIAIGKEKTWYGIAEEEAFKAKDAHALDKAYGFEKEKEKIDGKIPLVEDGFKHTISHEIADKSEKAFKIHEDELLKKEITHGTDALLHKGHEEELKKEKAFSTDAFLHKAFEDELIKKGEVFDKDVFHKALEEDLVKEKGFGAESFLHKAHEDELLKKEKTFDADAFLHKIHEGELIKKEKPFVDDAFLHKAHEDEILKKEKSFDSDAFLHKAHEDELLKKEKAFDVDAFLHKAHEDELLKKEKAFDADASLHKAHEDELLKKEKTFDIDAFMHKAHEDELLGKEKAFNADASIHKAQEDELIKKEIAYGTDALFHKDKDITEAAKDHDVLHGKSHKTIHELKAKFFELLRRVLRTRKCYLVTMRPAELLGIVNCVSRSKNPLLCEKFAMCEKKMPPRVIAALEKCQKETIPGEVKTCTKYAPLYPSAEIPLRIFQCVAINTRELIPEEQKMMIEFEECARVVKAESCARFKFLPH